MQIDLSKINQEEFVVREREIASDKCYLVFPKGVPTWSKDNLIYRSSIWNEEGKPVSLSFPKFFNYTEKPDLYPNPAKHKDYNILAKEDGSALIISVYKGELICRTRGVFDASEHENGFEINVLKEKYPEVFKISNFNEDVTYIYEWVSDNQRIVLKYDNCPDIYLIGAISHEDYSLIPQHVLDNYASLFKVKRPKYYKFDSLQECANAIKSLEGVEGVCLYYNNDQNIIKLKSDWFLKLFHMKSELASIEKVIDLFLQLNRPSFIGFYDFVARNLDFEIANQVRGELSRVCDADKEVNEILLGMKKFLEKIINLPTRKEQAKIIIESYGNTNRASFVFKLLDKKNLDKDDIKKLLFQVLKNE